MERISRENRLDILIAANTARRCLDILKKEGGYRKITEEYNGTEHFCKIDDETQVEKKGDKYLITLRTTEYHSLRSKDKTRKFIIQITYSNRIDRIQTNINNRGFHDKDEIHWRYLVERVESSII